MNKKRLIGYLFVTMSVGCIQAQEQKSSVPEYKLWYDCPAQVWTEALPLGNGRLGAMVYGTPGTEQIQLNEESIWAGRLMEDFSFDNAGRLAPVCQMQETVPVEVIC